MNVNEALSRCEKLDELIQIAWDAGLDRKAVIREGSFIAQMFAGGGELDSVVTLFWPVPRPLEVVDRWSEASRLGHEEKLRPFASAVVPGTVFGGLVSHYVVAPDLSKLVGQLVLTAIVVASIALLGLVLQRVIGLVLARRAATLDEDTALILVLVRLRGGVLRKPRLVPFMLPRLRKALQRVADPMAES